MIYLDSRKTKCEGSNVLNNTQLKFQIHELTKYVFSGKIIGENCCSCCGIVADVKICNICIEMGRMNT